VCFCLVDTKEDEGRGAAEGLRFGMWMALLVYLPQIVIWYGQGTIGSRAAAADFVVDALSCLLAGYVLAATDKGPPAQKGTA
jgi:hypothetical protein